MKKRGISHVEVVISFVIFAAAVGFGLYFFNPADPQRLIESTLTYAEREVMQNVSVQLETYSVIINNTDNQIMLANPEGIIAVNLSNGQSSLQIRVVNLSGHELPSRRVGDSVYFNNSWKEGNDFVYIYASEFSSESDEFSSYPEVDEKFYYLVTPSYQSVISEERIRKLLITYVTNYTLLKKEFNLPNRVDFGFALFFNETDRYIGERGSPQKAEHFSETQRVKVVRSNGEIAFADLVIKVW